jgi:hypothetical protein
MATESQEHNQTFREFNEVVNMAPKELEEWLETEESRAVGQDSGSGESIGHKSGRRIVDIKRTKKAELSDDDYKHMRKVVGYVHRHMAQKPSSPIADSNWRYSLKNWGHDPCKDAGIEC